MGCPQEDDLRRTKLLSRNESTLVLADAHVRKCDDCRLMDVVCGCKEQSIAAKICDYLIVHLTKLTWPVLRS
jgi:hypothetical protein